MKLYDLSTIAIVVIVIVISAFAFLDKDDESIEINIEIYKDEVEDDAGEKGQRWVQMGYERQGLPYQEASCSAGQGH